MSTTNPNRHSYTKFTKRPYVSRYGVGCLKTDYYGPQYAQDNRTIVRTNTPDNCIMNGIPDCGQWAHTVRKDVMYNRYANRNC
jgi:hypothetical protein